MRLTKLPAAAVLALTTSASTLALAQGQPAACASLPADSAEAAILGCGDAGREPEAFDEPLLEEEPDPPSAAAEPEPTPPAPGADEELVQLFAEWLDRHPLGSTVAPSSARLLEEDDLPPGLSLPPEGLRHAELDGMIVALDARTWELLDVVGRAPAAEAAPAPAEETGTEREEAEREAEAEAREREDAAEAAEREETERQERDQGDGGTSSGAITAAEAEARGIRIPRGHLPPPGECRLWFPDRPPGHQPPPTSCGAEVAEGAVLIRR